MSVNTFISFFDKADGESTVKGKEKWVEIIGWDWEVTAETVFGKTSGGASVGKATPGKMHFEHRYDTVSHVLMGYMCNGKAFPKVELQMMKTTGKGMPETYFTMTMDTVFITRASNSSTDDGSVMQSVELVFKNVKIEYKPVNAANNTLGGVRTFNWDVTTGISSPNG